MFVRVNRNEDKLGFLPIKNYQNFNLFHDLDEVLNGIDNFNGGSENLFSFISLPSLDTLPLFLVFPPRTYS